MSNIAKIDSQIAVASQFRGNAIEKRLAMINIPEVQDCLTQTEKSIFLATTKTQVSKISREKLFADLKQMLGFLIKDLGIRTELENYDYARFYDIVSRYFSEFSFPELKIAFEMAMIGELNNYLPRNGNGEPDKGHYQSFSVEYITKILTAYRKRRNVMLEKAYGAIPIQQTALPQESKNHLHNVMIANLRNIVLKYKYTGELIFRGVDEKLMYDVLVRTGYADEIIVGKEEKDRAMSLLISSAFLQQIQKHSIGKQKHEHDDVKFRGYIIARKNEIVRVLGLCIKNEIQLKEFIK